MYKVVAECICGWSQSKACEPFESKQTARDLEVAASLHEDRHVRKPKSHDTKITRRIA